MSGASPPIASFGRLAHLALDHDQWPAETSPKARSLSTLFSKLDRGQELDWLRDRPAVQLVLSELLGRPSTDIRTAIGEVHHPRHPRFLKLSDVRYAREIDLVTEEPPPGIPRRVLSPPQWQPIWWHCPAGGGRSIAGSWLKARGLAHAVVWQPKLHLHQLPLRGPLFIEIDDQQQALSLGSADWEQLRPHQRPLCIAAPFAAPKEGGFDEVHSADVRTYLPELVDWVAARLDGSGHFQPDRAEQWMRRVALSSGRTATLGEALGLLGMIDEVHPRTLLVSGIEELAAHFVKRRVREASAQAELSPRIAEEAFPALQACAARALVGKNFSLRRPYALDQWTQFLSDESKDDEPDPQWFTAALSGALGGKVSRRDLQSAARKLKPGAFRLAKSLQGAGLLSSSPSHSRSPELALSPTWLVSSLIAGSYVEALGFSPRSWGAVLLAGHHASDMIEAMRRQAQKGNFDAFFALLDDEGTAQIEHLAALEGSLIALAQSQLEGAKLPAELIEGLLELVAEQLFIVDELPVPHLTFDSHESTSFRSQWWYVALAILTVEHPFPIEQWDPHRECPEALKQKVVESARWVLCQEDQPETRRLASIWELVDSFCAETERPAALRLVVGPHPADEDLVRQALSECSLSTLTQLAESKGMSERQLYEKVWQGLASCPHPEGAWGQQEQLPAFWHAIPSRVLLARLTAQLPVAFQLLLPHHYSAWLGHQQGPALPAAAAQVCPIEPALAALDARGPSAFAQDAFEPFIERAGGRFAPYLTALLTEGRHAHPLALEQLLANCGPLASAWIVELLPADASLLKLPSADLDLVRAFLNRCVRARHAGFEQALTRALQLEQALGALRRLPAQRT